MQTQAKRKKFTLLDYCSFTSSNTISTIINNNSKVLYCICGKLDARKYSCFRCKNEVHICLQCYRNRCDQFYQCFSCLNQHLDPLYKVKKVLIESYFKIQNIFNVANQIKFQFQLSSQDRQIVQIRGLKPRKLLLSWPMTGTFFINQENQPFYQIRPLILNSNRKARREEYIQIPKQKLKRGKNTLIFKIYKLDVGKYTTRYQYEQKGLYYFSINLINKLSPSDLIAQTFKLRRFEKNQSLKLLNTKNNDIQISSQILTLICPYTKDRIKIPVRGKYCKHYSCVCLETVIAYHMSHRLWSCPICDCRINEPYVDVFVYTILRDNNKDGEEVTIHKDGKYQWVRKIDKIIDLDENHTNQVPLSSQAIQNSVFQNLVLLDLQQGEEQRKKQKQKKLLLSLIKDKMMLYGSKSVNSSKSGTSSEYRNGKNIQIKYQQQTKIITEVKTLQFQSMNSYELKGYIKKTIEARQHKLFIKNNTHFKNLFVKLIK